MSYHLNSLFLTHAACPTQVCGGSPPRSPSGPQADGGSTTMALHYLEYHGLYHHVWGESGDLCMGFPLSRTRSRPHHHFFFFFFFVFLPFSWAAPAAYGGSQARGQIGAAATSLRQSQSIPGSEPRLQPTPQLTATRDP